MRGTNALFYVEEMIEYIGYVWLNFLKQIAQQINYSLMTIFFNKSNLLFFPTRLKITTIEVFEKEREEKDTNQ